jgi:hypothetical protein
MINGFQIGFIVEKREAYYLLPLLDYYLLITTPQYRDAISTYDEYELTFEDGSLGFQVMGIAFHIEATIAFAYKNFDIFKQVESITLERINPNGALIRSAPSPTWPEGLKTAVDTGGLIRILQEFVENYEGNQFYLLDTLWGKGEIQVEDMLIGNDGNHYKLMGRTTGGFGRPTYLLYCKEEGTTHQIDGLQPYILFTNKPIMTPTYERAEVMMITNIHIETCHSRAQLGQPCTFVQWTIGGVVERHFVRLVGTAYSVKRHLENVIKEPDKELQESYYKEILKILK